VTGWQKVTTADGLLSNVVWAVAVDGGGNRWFGTDRGLSAFLADGRWARWRAGPGGLRDEPVLDVAAGAGGEVYVVTRGGASRLQDGGWDHWRPPVGVALRSVDVAPDGMVWMGTDAGAIAGPWGGEQRLFGEEEGLPSAMVNGVGFDPDGAVWVLTQGGAAAIRPDGTVRSYPGPEAWSFGVAADGERWIGGDLHLQAVGAEGPGEPNPGRVASSGARALVRAGDGVLWAAGTRGVQRLSGRFEVVTEADGLPGPSVSALAHDGESVWVHAGAGVSRLSAGGEWTTWTAADGLARDSVGALFHDGEALWVGCPGGVSRLDADGQIASWEIAGWWGGRPVTSLYARGGVLWVASHGGILRRASNGAWHHWTVDDGLLSDEVEVVWHGGGYLWAGTERGLSRRSQDGGWMHWTSADRVIPSGIRSV